jgi:ABC-2 type transport system ATP-binding protein
MSLVAVDALTVVFRHRIWRRHTALDAVSLQVEEGDIFALLGPNGAGKSTAVYCVLGLVPPTRGEVRVFGEQLTPGSRRFRDVAFLPEEPHYHEYLTVEEAVTYYAALGGADVGRARISSVLEQLRLDKVRSTRLASCSKGMKQKVGIAQCLLREPRLLVLDEPMRGLDPVTVKEFRDVLVDLNRRGVTIVMNSHLLSEVEQVASRAAILDEGRVLAVKPLSELTVERTDVYLIEVDGLPSAPEYMTVDEAAGGRLRGSIPAGRLFDLMESVRSAGAVLRSCRLKKDTLEESFLAVLRQADGHA